MAEFERILLMMRDWTDGSIKHSSQPTRSHRLAKAISGHAASCRSLSQNVARAGPAERRRLPLTRNAAIQNRTKDERIELVALATRLAVNKPPFISKIPRR